MRRSTLLDALIAVAIGVYSLTEVFVEHIYAAYETGLVRPGD
jgi:hypothetical protein